VQGLKTTLLTVILTVWLVWFLPLILVTAIAVHPLVFILLSILLIYPLYNRLATREKRALQNKLKPTATDKAFEKALKDYLETART